MPRSHSRHELAVALFVAILLAAGPGSAQVGPAAPARTLDGADAGVRDPIATTAYGVLFGPDGKPIDPTPEFLRETMDFYIARLLAAGNDGIRAGYDDHARALAERFGSDEMTPRFLLLEWLSETVAPPNKAFLFAKNRAMRMAWYKRLLGEKRYYEVFDLESGLPRDILEIGEGRGMLRKATMSSGPEYMRECREAGVPVPPPWGDDDWKEVGDLTTNFVGSGNPATLYRFDSGSPEGLCLALPRINGDTISLLGIICHGKVSSNVCFYDNAGVPVDATVPIEDFLSGASLGDVCSDCHAGENPYVVHGTGNVLDLAPDNRTDAWHTPLVRPDWPQNPGPSGLLAQVPINPLGPDNDASCLECHAAFATGGVGGRFPDIPALNQISTAITGQARSGYCSTVVLNAMGQTMPGGGAYQKHVDAMKAFCDQSSPPGGTVPPPDAGDDESVLSPPIVVGPLFACAEGIEVHGARYDAELTVTVAGVDLPTIKVKQPSQTIVPSPPLLAGDVVTAVQSLGGQKSDPSQPVTVIDHTVAYPSGLPAPIIDPTVIFECGRTIAVRHARGARVSVFTNDADEAAYATGGDWTNLPPAIRPFVLNDKYTARQAFCTDRSDPSAPESAVLGPSPLPTPVIAPTPPIQGQPVVDLSNLPNGAETVLSHSPTGELARFATAVDRQHEVDVATGLGRPLDPGDQLSVVASLCEDVKVSFPDAQPCERLPAPVIDRPLVGATSVSVTSAAPGAQILIYDAALDEIGDGTGVEIGLTRALVVGDVLTVTQRLGRCTSGEAYQIAAVCASAGACG